MATGGDAFPSADVAKELTPGDNREFAVDSVSTGIAASKEIKEGKEAEEKKREQEKCEAMQKLKTTALISAVVVAVVGAAFAITKKFRERSISTEK